MRDAGERDEIEFDFGGKTLRGWFFKPATEPPWPAIVMAHGFSGVKEQGVDWFAAAFRQAGLSALVFDFPNLGASDGEPRCDIDPDEQVAAIESAIGFASTIEGVDSERIGLWGTSYSGGHVLNVAASDGRVKCVVAQVPHVGVAFEVPEAMEAMFAAERERRKSGSDPMMIPVVGGGGGFAALPTPDAEEWAMNLADEAPSWRNEVTLSSVDRMLHYNPVATIEEISPIPMLILLGERDSLIPASLVREVFGRAGEPKKLVAIDCGHFDVYERCFEEASSAECDFFARYLLG